MKKRVLLVLLLFLTAFARTSCIDNQKVDENIMENDAITGNEFDKNMEIIKNANVILNGKSYNAVLENNETAQAFAKLLPMEFNMNELNGNEKYVYIDGSLPTNSSSPRYIVAGDIMLYNNNCLVIFYKSFNTSYSYTKIGHIDNLPDLGNGNVTVTFSID